eukprot:210827-Pleurochrysis_carterae.AAC.1
MRSSLRVLKNFSLRSPPEVVHLCIRAIAKKVLGGVLQMSHSHYTRLFMSIHPQHDHSHCGGSSPVVANIAHVAARMVVDKRRYFGRTNARA